ncbi:hypothetical protein CMV_012546 [Castanea mollissima]|uniref:Uncharacterized protein n=1 Tax=Castanea mollissima TaxID=60419 RepID=A0A8J4R121_9ROSI|nr:hypothetical protein CMV_012546 [Castanea mollissima]
MHLHIHIHIIPQPQVFTSSASKSLDVPKDYLAVYVGEGEKKRFVIPISFLNQPTFQQLLNKAKEGLLYVIFFVHIVMNFSEGL